MLITARGAIKHHLGQFLRVVWSVNMKTHINSLPYLRSDSGAPTSEALPVPVVSRFYAPGGPGSMPKEPSVDRSEVRPGSPRNEGLAKQSVQVDLWRGSRAAASHRQVWIVWVLVPVVGGSDVGINLYISDSRVRFISVTSSLATGAVIDNKN